MLFFLLFHNSIAKKIGFFDHVASSRKIHKKPTSLLGGVYFFLNLVFYFLFSFYQQINNIDLSLYYLFIFISLIFFIGLIDDLKNLSANKKLLIFIITIGLFLFFSQDYLILGIKSFFIVYDFENIFLSIFLTIFCILLFINAFNMIDGINCLASSYIFFICLFLLNPSDLLVRVLLLTNVMFFILNYKNKIFLGNNGSYLVSIILSLLIIKDYNNNLIVNVDLIFFSMSIIGYDLLRVAIHRLSRGEHPFKSDNNHLHHYVLKKQKNHFFSSIICIIIISSPSIFFIIFNKFFLTYVFSLFLYFFFYNLFFSQ